MYVPLRNGQTARCNMCHVPVINRKSASFRQMAIRRAPRHPSTLAIAPISPLAQIINCNHLICLLHKRKEQESAKKQQFAKVPKAGRADSGKHKQFPHFWPKIRGTRTRNYKLRTAYYGLVHRGNFKCK